MKREVVNMELQTHPLFGQLEYDDYEGYKTNIIVKVRGEEIKIELIISEYLFGDGGIEEAHCEAYIALMENWDNIMQDVFQNIIEYQNDEWDSTDYSASFPLFESIDDVVKNTKITGITLNLHPEEYGMFRGQEGRFVVLLFNAEWVNDDYRILSVALINEKVVEVTDQNI